MTTEQHTRAPADMAAFSSAEEVRDYIARTNAFFPRRRAVVADDTTL